MSKEVKYLYIFLLFIGILKFCFFTNTIIPPYDSYEFLLAAKNLRANHSYLIDAGLDYKITPFREPGYPLLIALGYPLFQDFEASAALVTVISSILSIFFIYLLMEKIKKGTGKFAAFLLATSWLHLLCSSLILREIPSLCFIIIILYFFYGKPLSLSKTIALGVLIAFASLIHLTNVALLFPFLYLLIKEKKIKRILFLLGSYGLILWPYACLRVYKWPYGPLEVKTWYYVKEITGIPLIYSYFKSIFFKFMQWEPSLFIFGLIGIFLAARKNMAKNFAVCFWGIYLLGYLFIFFLLAAKVVIGIKTFEDSYLIPFLPPFILAGSIYLNYLFDFKSVSTKASRWANGITACFIFVLIIINHWAIKDLLVNKLISRDITGYRFIFFSSAFLFILACLLILFFRKKKIFQKIIITGLLLAFSIQVFDEIIKIKGRHIMTTRGKELSSDINALKGKVLPQDALLVGVEDAMGILYHTGYPLFYEKYDRLIAAHTLGKKWNTKTMTRIINLSKSKPVICVYDHLYRYYLSDFGNELYESIQENYQDNLCFSNLKLNLKIYLLDNISPAPSYERFYAEAIDYYAGQMRNRPDDISLLNYLGWAYFNSGAFDAAIKKWGEKEALTTKDADVHNNIGLAYYRKGSYRQAIVEYNKALMFKPVDDPPRQRWARAMIYFNLAQAYEKANEKEKAIISWKNYYESIPYIENKIIMEKHIKRIGGQNLN